MSSSPTFILNPTSGVEEEEMLAIDQGRSHIPPPRSRPNSRLEILIMDMARSTEQRFESFARAQSEQSKFTKEQIEERFESLARSQAEQSRSTEEKLDGLARSTELKFDGLARSTESKLDEFARSHTAELSNMMGRLSSLEVSRHGTPSPSPNPGRRGSPSSAETMHVSVPSTNGDLVPLSPAEVRRS